MRVRTEAETLVVPGGKDHGPLALPLLTLRGRQDGPRVAILGGVHGDEYEGTAAAGLVWRDLDPEQLRGTVHIVPVANPPAFAAGQRASPVDGLDLARSFPGDGRGSLSRRIAHALAERVIRGADLLIDLHSAGQHYAMPLLVGCYAGRDALGRRSRAAALAFGAPVFWSHPTIAPGRSLSAALAAGVPCIYAESGGGGRVRAPHLAAYRRGVRRVLAHLGSLPGEAAGPADEPPHVWLRDSGDLDRAQTVAHGGVLLERARLLDRVAAGQPLGEVLDERGVVLETVRAASRGVLVMARRTARVRPGDRVYVLAPEDASRRRSRAARAMVG